MTTGIYVAHTPAQAELASALCDLLELALSLPEGGILCSSLPGYAAPTGQLEAWYSELAEARAIVALIDEDALGQAQLVFELGTAACYQKWTALVLEDRTLHARLPWQLADMVSVERGDRAALVSMLEDLAFQLGVQPRLGADVQDAIAQFMQDATTSIAQRSAPRRAAASELRASAPLPPPLFEATEPADVEDEFVALGDEDLRELGSGSVTCGLSLEAGRAISECSFHRTAGGRLSVELDEPFGRFVDAVGGNWEELKRLEDVDVWLGATDNLLESLPPEARHVSDWFELGFQFSTLMSIAEQGLPDDPQQRAEVEQVWQRSMEQFERSALGAQLRHTDVHRVQHLLENLIKPHGRRDYSNIPRSLETLRNYAAMADG